MLQSVIAMEGRSSVSPLLLQVGKQTSKDVSIDEFQNLLFHSHLAILYPAHVPVKLVEMRPGGDGWVYSYHHASSKKPGRPKIWKTY